MQAPFYPDVFARRGMSVVRPNEDERSRIHTAYVGELLEGDFREETAAMIRAIVARLRNDEHVDGVILGGTELPLLLQSSDIAALPTLDTTAIHVNAIVDRLTAS